jgi:hypothetical protein
VWERVRGMEGAVRGCEARWRLGRCARERGVGWAYPSRWRHAFRCPASMQPLYWRGPDEPRGRLGPPLRPVDVLKKQDPFFISVRTALWLFSRRCKPRLCLLRRLRLGEGRASRLVRLGASASPAFSALLLQCFVPSAAAT